MTFARRGAWPVIVLTALLRLAHGAPAWAGQEEPPPDVLTDYAAILNDPDDEKDALKRYAAVVLGIQRHVEAAQTLNAVLGRHISPSVRAAAAWALGELRQDSSLMPLVAATKDRDAAVRQSAIAALALYEEPESLDALADIARNGPGPDALAAWKALAAADTPERRARLDALPTDPARFADASFPVAKATGRAIYVDATSGDDGGDGTEARPFRTMVRATAELRGGVGDRVLATSGDANKPFYETVEIPRAASGLPNLPTTIAAWPGRPRPILDGASPAKSDVPQRDDGFHTAASYIHIDGFIVRRFVDSGVDFDGGMGCVVSRTRVEHCTRHGIFFYYAPNGVVYDCEVEGCDYQGISIRSSPRPAVLGGRSINNGIDGLLLLWDTDGALVSEFSAWGNRRGIAFIEGSNDGRVIGPVLRDNKDHDLFFDPDSGALVVPLPAPAAISSP